MNQNLSFDRMAKGFTPFFVFLLRVFSLLITVLFCGTHTSYASSSNELLSLPQARDYLVILINRDRLSKGLKPVKLDSIATVSGQIHAKDMATKGFLSHYNTLGQKPNQRYNDAGGKGAVLENASLYWYPPGTYPSSSNFTAQTDAKFSKGYLEETEASLFNETPPNDYHRRNILDPDHNGVGIGLSQAVSADGHYRVSCTEEFTNSWGVFSSLPKVVTGNQTFFVKGRLRSGLDIRGIEVLKEELPRPMTIEQVNKLRSYAFPDEPILGYYPPPYSSSAPVERVLRGGCVDFSVKVSPKTRWSRGLYNVVIFARRLSDDHEVWISSRIFICN